MVINKIISDIEYLKAFNYLTTKIAPNNLSIKFWKQAKLYKLSNNKWDIYINNKKIIPQSDITATIKHLWFNPLYKRVGINRFYDHIKTKYIGITKQAVKDFLNSLESYQLHKRLIKVKTVNPIVPTAPNH